MAKATALPTILITNDDGITAPGIRNLVEAVKELGKIIVVAPDKPQRLEAYCECNVTQFRRCAARFADSDRS